MLVEVIGFYKVYKIGDAYVVDSNHYGTCDIFTSYDEVLDLVKRGVENESGFNNKIL